jgi:hypothetical protein
MKGGPIALAALALLAAQGCTAQTRTGDLKVSWTIGLDEPSIDQCSAAGIESILITLDGEEHDELEDATCATGERTFHGLPVMGYTVRVQGMDREGCAVYEGRLANAVPSEEEDPAEIDVIMQRVTPGGSVTITWRFLDGMMCGAHGIEVVHLELLSEDAMVLETDLSCHDGRVVVSDVPAGSVDLRLSALEGAMEMCYVATNLELVPCDALEVEASLEPCI